MVLHAFEDMVGGEIYVNKIPSMKITDEATSTTPEAQQEIVGLRTGEKLHEQMFSVEDAPYTNEYDDYFRILPAINNWYQDSKRICKGKMVSPDFVYSSDNNKEWMTVGDFKNWVEKHQEII